MPDDPEVFGEATVLRHQTALGTAAVGPYVVVATAAGDVFALEGQAQVIWPLFDGSVTLGELADDVAEAFGAPRQTVFADLSRYALELIGRGCLSRVSDPPLPSPSGHLQPPTNSCNCSIPNVTWCASSTLHLGLHTIGVRSNLPEIDAALRAMLPTHLVADHEAPPNLSVVFRGPGTDAKVPSLELYHGLQLAGRSPSSAVVRQSLIQHLGTLARIGGEHLVLAATAVGGPDGVVLVGSHLGPSLSFLSPALHRRGLMTGASVSAIDTTTAEVVIDGGDIVIDPAGTARFDGLCDWNDTAPGALPPGRYPLLAMALVDTTRRTPEDTPPNDGEPERLLALLREVLPLVMGLATIGPQPAVDGILRLAETVATRRADDDDLAAWVLGHLDDGTCA